MNSPALFHSSPLKGNPMTASAMKLANGSEHQRLTDQAQKWVSQTFYGTLLKQMRESPFRSAMFDGGKGGQAFGTMFDERLAEHMGKSAGNKLVRSIVKKIEAGRKLKKTGIGYGLSGANASTEALLPKAKSRTSARDWSKVHSHVATNIRA